MDKRCIICNNTLPTDSFYRNRTAKDGLQTHCKACSKATVAAWQKKYPDRAYANSKRWRTGNQEQYRQAEKDRRARQSHARKSLVWRRADLKKNYGLTIEAYDAILAAQGGVCAICGDPPMAKDGRRLAVDHNHESKRNRGLLCGPCNGALDRIEKDSEWGTKAVAYLMKYVMADLEKSST